MLGEVTCLFDHSVSLRVLAKRQIQSMSNTQGVHGQALWDVCGGIISMIAQFAIDVPGYQKHCWVVRRGRVVGLAPFHEAEQ